MKKHCLYFCTLSFLLYVFFCLSAWGNKKTDSLQLLLSVATSKDSHKVMVLNELGWTFYQESYYDTAKHYAEKALALAQQIDFKSGMAMSYNIIGGVYSVKADFLSALEYYQSALRIRQEIDDTSGIAGIFSNIGMIYYRQAMYTEALKYFLDALKADQQNGDSSGIATDFTYIGMVYKDQGNLKQALEYYKQSLSIQQLTQDSTNMATTYFNIGNAYYSMGNIEKAILNNEKALGIIQRNSGSKHPIAFYHLSTGVMYKTQKDHTKARNNLLRAQKLYLEIGDKQGHAKVNYHLADLYLNQNKQAEAKELLTQVLQIGKEMEDIALLRDAYLTLAIADSLSGNYLSAWNQYKQYTIYKDSLFNEENTKEITKLQMNYTFSQKEDSIIMMNQKELAVKEAILTARTKQQWLMAGGIILLCIIGGLLFYQNRDQHKNNLKLTRLNTELDEKSAQNILLVKEMHHRIKNNLHMVYSLLDIQSHNTANSETQQLLQSARQRIENIANTHEQLYQNQPEKVLMKSYIHQFVNRSLLQFSSVKTIATHIHIEPSITLLTTKCMPLAMLINEWLTNSIKYAQKDNNEIHIHIEAIINQSNEIVLEYYDNGNLQEQTSEPISNEFPTSPGGIGKRIIQLLSRQMNARLETDYNNTPYHYRISFSA